MDGFLKDSWEVTGTETEALKETIDFISNNTEVKRVNMDDIYFLSISEGSDGRRIGVPLHSDQIFKKTKTSLCLKQYPISASLYEKRYESEILNEGFANGLWMEAFAKRPSAKKIEELITDGGYVPVSAKAMNTISSRVNYAGAGFFSERLIRDMAISKKFNKPIPVNIVVRSDEKKSSKVFAVMSQKYAFMNQKKIFDMIEIIKDSAKKDLGDAVCNFWRVSHSITQVFMEFPDASKEISKTYELPENIIPGIMIETSDIGDCALRVKGYYRIEDANTIFYMEEEFSQIHSGEIDMPDMLSKVRNEIFPKYLEYPKHFADLMMIDLTTDEMSDRVKTKTMTSIYRSVSKKCGIVKAIGKKREKALVDSMIECLNPAINYTAYDVVMDFFVTFGQNESNNRSLSEAFAKITPEIMKYDFEPKKEELSVEE